LELLESAISLMGGMPLIPVSSRRGRSMMLQLLASIIFSLFLPPASSVAATEVLSTSELDTRFTSSPNLPPPGKNLNGTSVTTNFVRAYNEKQIFLYMPITIAQFETPASPTLRSEQIWWCADLNFSNFVNDINEPMGNVGRCVWKFTKGGLETVASGVQGYLDDPTDGFSSTLGISSVFVESKNIFEYEGHRNTENMVTRFWDDGQTTMPLIMWVTHDGVETTVAHQVTGKFVWLSANEAARVIGVTATSLTPERFSDVYASVWNNLYNSKEPSSNSTTDNASNDGNVSSADGNTSTPDNSHSGGARRKLGLIDTRVMRQILRVFGM